MLEFFAGCAIGFAALYAAEVWRGSRISKRQRRQMARFADFQRSVLDVQDFVAFCALTRAGGESAENRRLESWRIKVAARDQALAAYLAAMGE